MRARVVKIGNSQGIRIPKTLLDQTGIVDEVELDIEKEKIVIRPVSDPRLGWEKSFKTMSDNHDDALVDGDENLSHSWDEQEWQW
ncbi:MAG: AbrB/MazE/SpoVT family DNA-binding domain-containing protein [Deltaproteobacteria bacterium]|nr:AbrB/MazE/SpoVT family DNA-binding domain-containing protein [Deltaproteobacteria bacterium]